MTWPVMSAAALVNLTAPAFDVRYRFFGNPAAFGALTDLVNFTENEWPTDWGMPVTNVIVPSGDWVELAGATGEVLYDGKLERSLSGATVSWSATLRGYRYNASLLSRGQALVCLRQIRRRAFGANAAYDSGWRLYFLGIVASYDTTADYRRAGSWSLTVNDVSEAIRLIDAPRLIAAPLNIAIGSAVTASSTLATPASEAGTLEFVGVSANVEAGNIVDGRKATVWISQDPPVVEGDDLNVPATFSMWTAQEIFAWPVAGYSNLNAWWVEILNTSDLAFGNLDIITRNQAGELVGFKIPGTLASGERGIVCGDVDIFEAMTGGAKSCKWVIAAREQRVRTYLGFSEDNFVIYGAEGKAFNLDPANGWVGILTSNRGNAVRWGNPVLDDTDDSCYFFNPVHGFVLTGSITGIQAGWSLRRKPSGSSTFVLDPYPKPGALTKWKHNVPQYVKIELPAQGALLAVDAPAGSLSMTLSDTTGWLQPVPGELGGGIVGAEAFTYAYRSATQLQDINVAGLVQNHYIGEAVSPLFPATGAQAETMTGWPLASLEIARLPGRPMIKRAEVFLSRYASTDTPNLADKTEVVWRTDYDLPPLAIENGTTAVDAQATITLALQARACPWVRSILILIHEMWDAGRAKVNEVRPYLDQMALNDSTAAQIGVTKSAALAEYVLDNYVVLPEGAIFGAMGGGRFTDETPAGYGLIGRLALAVSPVPGVLDDLARTTGCVIEWTLDGRVKWWPDPFWPGGLLPTGPDATLTADAWRGELTYDDSAEAVTGIALTAQSTAGEPLQRVVVPPGATGSGVSAVDGYTIAAGREQALAEVIFRQATHQQRIALTLTGVGEGIRPLHRYAIQGPDGTDLGIWLADSVSTSWANKDGVRTHFVEISLRQYLQ